MRRGKKYQQMTQLVDKKRSYAFSEAVEFIKAHAFAKFDESVDLSLVLNVKKGAVVRDTVIFPHSFHKARRILVFAEGAKAQEAQEAGATYVGSSEYVEKIKEGWLDFDVVLSTPDMMREVGRLGAILGKRGLMPTPKTQTVTLNLKEMVGEFSQGKFEYRSDKNGVLHLSIGKVSMSVLQLVENLQQLLKEMQQKKPAEVKVLYFKKARLASTMGPGLQLEMKGLI